MLKTKWPHDRFVLNMWIPILGKDILYIETGPCLLRMPRSDLELRKDEMMIS